MKRPQALGNLITITAAVVLGLGVTALMLAAVNAPPGEVFTKMLRGAFGRLKDNGELNLLNSRTGATLTFWVPLFFCSTGLLLTFTGGLWNIGIEGQMTMGALAASAVAINLGEIEPALPNALLLALELAAAAAGGALWAALCGVLKTRGKVHEIFGGMALNYIATSFTIYFIAGPWQPPEGGSAQSTPPFEAHTLLPRLEESNLSLLALALAVVLFLGVILMLGGTFWGLQLKAMGRNPRSAFLLGVPTEKHTLIAFAMCGALAGLAGSTRVLWFYDKLRPNIAGGIGFLALLVVLLARARRAWARGLLVLFISLFFAVLAGGSTYIKTLMGLDASLSGVLQGVLVLSVIIALGIRGRLADRRTGTVSADAAE